MKKEKNVYDSSIEDIEMLADSDEQIDDFSEESETEEAKRTFRRISEVTERNPEVIAKMLKMRKSKDSHEVEMAEEWLVEQLTPIITAIARFRFGSYQEKYGEDMCQVAWIYLMDHLDTYDATKGSMFTYFSSWCIAAMNRYVAYFIKQTTPYLSSLYGKISAAQIRLAEKGITSPTVTDYVLETGIRPISVRHALDAMTFSSQTSIETDSSVTSLAITNKEDEPEAAILKKMQNENLQKALMELPTIQRDVVSMMYGVGEYDEPLGRLQVAQAVGITVDKLNRIMYEAIRRLRNSRYLSSEQTIEDEVHNDLFDEPIAVTPDGVAHGMIDELEALDNEEDLTF